MEQKLSSIVTRQINLHNYLLQKIMHSNTRKLRPKPLIFYWSYYFTYNHVRTYFQCYHGGSNEFIIFTLKELNWTYFLSHVISKIPIMTTSELAILKKTFVCNFYITSDVATHLSILDSQITLNGHMVHSQFWTTLQGLLVIILLPLRYNCDCMNSTINASYDISSDCSAYNDCSIIIAWSNEFKIHVIYF
jgi:hypothetical protein